MIHSWKRALPEGASGVFERGGKTAPEIDEQFLEAPVFGGRQMTWHLRNEGDLVNEKRRRRLKRLMGLMPIYRKPDTGKAAKEHKTYPYPLRGLRVDRPTQVWCAGITSLPMRRGFLYPVAIMDWHTRKVLGLAHLEHAGGGVLRRGVERSHPPLRPARDHEHRPRQSVHVLRLDRPSAPIRRAHLKGWQRPLPRQHFCRAALAIPEIRMRLPARLGNRITSPGRDRKVGRGLQP